MRIVWPGWTLSPAYPRRLTIPENRAAPPFPFLQDLILACHRLIHANKIKTDLIRRISTHTAPILQEYPRQCPPRANRRVVRQWGRPAAQAPSPGSLTIPDRDQPRRCTPREAMHSGLGQHPHQITSFSAKSSRGRTNRRSSWACPESLAKFFRRLRSELWSTRIDENPRIILSHYAPDQ